jgi:hypothetical protein
MSGSSLISLGDISKPATVLIEKISAAVGAIYKPYQIKRVAKAEADATMISTIAKMKTSELQRRAIDRMLFEESRKQITIESITSQAIDELKPNAKPEEIDDDWITNFFDKCCLASDTRVQAIWAKILAGKANSPSSFSKRTVNTLASLDRKDAELFTSICGFVWSVDDIDPLIFDTRAVIYTSRGITFDTLNYLVETGLVSFNPVVELSRIKLPKKIQVSYFNTTFEIKFSGQRSENELPIGHVLFTTMGRELASICNAKPVKGFVEYTRGKWQRQAIEIRNLIV